MIDLDAAGRVTGWAQVLDDAHFAQIAPGQSRDDVLPRLGHPFDTRYIGWQKLVVWAYRYDTPMCQWFQVSFDTHWSVADVSYGPDPRCEAGTTMRPPGSLRASTRDATRPAPTSR